MNEMTKTARELAKIKSMVAREPGEDDDLGAETEAKFLTVLESDFLTPEQIKESRRIFIEHGTGAQAEYLASCYRKKGTHE